MLVSRGGNTLSAAGCSDDAHKWQHSVDGDVMMKLRKSEAVFQKRQHILYAGMFLGRVFVNRHKGCKCNNSIRASHPEVWAFLVGRNLYSC